MTGLLAVLLAATPLTLNEVREASRQNLDALKAELETRKSGQSVRSAWSAIHPHVSMDFGVSDYVAGPQRTFNTIPKVAPDGTVTYEQTAFDVPAFSRGNFNFDIVVNQLLYDGGRWWNQIALAGAQLDAVKGQLAEQQLASELEAVRRFYELVRAQLTLEILSAAVTRSEEQVRRSNALFTAARAQRRDVLDAETNLGNDRISVLRQEQAITAAQVDLLQWLGRPQSEVAAVPPDAIDPHTAPVPAPGADAVLKAARARRPLLKVIADQLHASELSVDVARADFFPKVSANLSYQRGSPTADPFFTNPARQNAIAFGAQLSWDLYAGFSTTAAVERARIDRLGLENQKRQTAADLEAEVRRGVKTLQTQVSVAALAEKNRALAEDQFKLETERYAAGAGSSLEVRNAELKLTQAQLTLVQSRIDVEIARAALDRSVGTPMEATP